MIAEAHQKVTASHLKRGAYLYIRQSTVRQVFENTESTKRQYALRQRAIALGWPAEQIVVIDTDLGKSGASATDREGFQRLVAEVGMGQAGIVLGLEVSRLARNSMDWHRLLEMCGLTDTLILDEDGVYNPCDFNDRLLLGLKGTMSEAELHLMRSRLRGGILNKARRGELRGPLPVGLGYDVQEKVILDPDLQVQGSIRHLFETFRRTGSARATVKVFREEGLTFPRRPRRGPRKGELFWGSLIHWRVLQVLHNPRYAGAFVFGRTRTRKHPDGRTSIRSLPREEWQVLIPDQHPGYIPWGEYEENQKRLLENAVAHGRDRRKSPPREGPALLQGAVICGVCGRRMTIRYHQRRGDVLPEYICQRQGIETATPICQRIPGAGLDESIGELLLRTVTSTVLEVALRVQQELESRREEVDRLHRQQLERTRYDAELARRRYMKVDPDNRLVADALEAEWNEKLRVLTEAQEEYGRQSKKSGRELSEEQRARIRDLATDFPAIWKDPRTPHRERKRMVRLLIEDVTLLRNEAITAHVRFKGGQTETLSLPIPLNAWQMRQTPAQVVQEIDRLLDDHTEGEIPTILNRRGFTSGEGQAFHRMIVQKIRRKYELRPRYERLRERGMQTVAEMAELLGVQSCTIKTWRREGLLRGHAYDDKNGRLYEPPGPDAPTKMQGRKLSTRRRFPSVPAVGSHEVQSDE
ncbi:MAG: recombinase family protein [Planctomycetota bacterium]|nr:recombinase family protein [Planctomycetota bacterium]